MSDINDIIRGRKSVYPPKFIQKDVPQDILMELFKNANSAPTHKLTQPWRFKVFAGDARKQLSEFSVAKYKEITPKFRESKAEKIAFNTSSSPVVIAIILHRDEQERIPEWEEIAAVGMAVQNLWIALSQYGLGGYWSSPPFSEHLGELVALKPNERCLGFFYMGYCEPSDFMVPKGPVEDKVEWVSA